MSPDAVAFASLGSWLLRKVEHYGPFPAGHPLLGPNRSTGRDYRARQRCHRSSMLSGQCHTAADAYGEGTESGQPGYHCNQLTDTR
jgi:hypothetical protein